LQKFEADGGNLKDLGKEIRDNGLFVPSVIGLWNALPPTKELWDKSLADTRNRMRMASDIGAQHIQTIPNTIGLNYNQKWAADRYRDIIEMGINDYKLNPALVFVKYFPVKTLGQAVGIALDANHPKAMVIPDVYHMYISEGGFEGIKLLRGDMIAIFQFNDAPAAPPLDQLNDSHRVYPGDGVLPLPQIFKDLKGTGYKGCISLEMYNPEYWKEDLMMVAANRTQKNIGSSSKGRGIVWYLYKTTKMSCQINKKGRMHLHPALFYALFNLRRQYNRFVQESRPFPSDQFRILCMNVPVQDQGNIHDKLRSMQQYFY
jgi:2-keto-myo-inositol isomerase